MPEFQFKEMLDIEGWTFYADADLDDLAKNMLRVTPALSKIPAGYTYLSQFVDHDISLDSLARVMPWETMNLSKLFNERNPIFDLETLYGKAAEESSKYQETDSPRLKLGETHFDISSSVKQPIKQDLWRNSKGIADLLDKRNDENLLVAQMHVAFATFHNTIADGIPQGDVVQRYKEARRQTIRHYQYIILTDLLPIILNLDVLDDVKKNGNKFYNPAADDSFIPLEYSVAAFRMGHAMTRNRYQLNSLKSENLASLMEFTGNGSFIRQTKKLQGDWLLNWNLFFNLTGWKEDNPPDKFNFALKINTEIASVLGDFRGLVGFHRQSSIPALDLYRGRVLNLRSGQTVAAKMNETLSDPNKITVLEADKIADLLPEKLKNKLNKNTPLWFYILAEAQIDEDGERLGKLGSRIVAEVFLELLRRSPHSILSKNLPTEINLSPADETFLGQADGKFGMPEMLNFIEEKSNGFLKPIGV